jgi:N-sulfoglucosamine sulfohydrolase
MTRALLYFICTLTCASAAAGRPPNILWIISDDHSWNQLGCYGHPDAKTPRIDALAAEGIRFNRCYVTSPQCLPSRATFLAGRSPIGMGMTRFTTPLRKEIAIFPEALKKDGYFTAIAGRAHHIDGWSYTKTIPALYAKHQLPNASARFDFARDSNRGTSEERRDEFFRHLDEFFTAAPKDKPFFLQFNLLDPHLPVSSRELNPFANLYDSAKLTLPPDWPDTPAFREHYALFLGLVSRMDHDVGRVLDILDQRGLSENTLVVFAGDNGAAVFRGKGTLYENGIRVPLIVRWPSKVQPASVSDALVSGEDFAPTMLDALGKKVPDEMTGRSFLPALLGKPGQPRGEVFSARSAHGDPLPSNSSCFDLSRCIVTPTHKLIYNATWQIPYWPVDFFTQPFWLELAEMNHTRTLDKKFQQLLFAPNRPMFELYDLTKDPHEMENLAGKPDASATENDLRLRLTEWMLLENDYLPLPAPDAPPER